MNPSRSDPDDLHQQVSNEEQGSRAIRLYGQTASAT